MTPHALFVTAMLTPVAAVLVASAVSRRRRGVIIERWRAASAVLSGLFLALAVLAVAGWTLPDALDGLPSSERRAIGPALDASPECGLVPFARVLRVEVRHSPEQGATLHYTCGITHLGVPRFSNEATCADGSWLGPGVRDLWNAGSCRELLGP